MNVEALAAYFNKAAPRQFVLGKFDCVSFVFESVNVGWGRDYLDNLGYSTRREAVCAGLGQDLPMCELESGDIAWVPPACIGLIMHDYVAIKTHRTIVKLPLDAVHTGWKTNGIET